MDSRNENSTIWKEKFSQISKYGWGKSNNISFNLIKKADIKPRQYEYIYRKLTEWNKFTYQRNIDIWRIQLLSGETSYFQKHAKKLNKCNESPLLYAIWSGNLPLAKR